MNHNVLKIFDALKLNPGRLVSFSENGDYQHAGDIHLEIKKLTRYILGLTAPAIRIHSNNSTTLLISFFATLNAGKIPVLLPNQRQKTLEYFQGIYPQAIDDNILLILSPLPENLPETLSLEVLLSRTFYIYTSGSTGTPKKVEKTLSHLVQEVQTLERHFSLPDQTPVVATVSPTHLYGLLFRALWPFLSQRLFAAYQIEFPEQLTALNFLGAHPLLVTTPSFLKRIDSESSQFLNSLHGIISSGGALSPKTQQQIQKLTGHAVTEVFGSTETGGVAFRQGDSLWTLFGDVVPRNFEDGALQIESPFFPEDFLEMSDNVKWETAQKFSLHGRADRVVKIEETRVSLAEMEQKIALHPFFAEGRALSHQGSRQQILVVAILTPKGTQHLQTQGRFSLRQSLRTHLNQFFNAIVLPRQLRCLAQWPLNSQGKIEMASLYELFDE